MWRWITSSPSTCRADARRGHVIPRLATVLSAREWESALVALARETAEARVVLRVHRPEDLEDEASRIDVVVAGTETPWLTPARISRWRRLGMRVIGVYPAGDGPARARLLCAGVEELFSDTAPAAAMLRSIRLIGVTRIEAQKTSTVIAVSGPRGAPGRTETALAIAWAAAKLGPALLLDMDLEAPSLAIRTGRNPRPDVTDAYEAVAHDGRLPPWATQRFGPLAVIVGSHRRTGELLASCAAADLVEAARAASTTIIVDAGPGPAASGMVRSADHTVLVAGGSPDGLVRAAHLIGDWTGPTPLLLLNRVPPGDKAGLLVAARHCLGLEPAVVVAEHPEIATTTCRAATPHALLVEAARRMLDLFRSPADSLPSPAPSRRAGARWPAPS
jgi:Mrp family chromosome partitioning ATPase